jgi:hypothetical protein
MVCYNHGFLKFRQRSSLSLSGSHSTQFHTKNNPSYCSMGTHTGRIVLRR